MRAPLGDSRNLPSRTLLPGACGIGASSCAHNWGTEHAERWIWLHCTGFEGDGDAWLDVVLARLRVGP